MGLKRGQGVLVMTDSFVFVKCGVNESKRLLKALNPLFETRDFDPQKTTVMSANLPFYPDHRLIEITDHEQFPVVKRRAITTRDNKADIDAYLIDYTAQTIEHLNKEAGLIINERTVIDYARFYFDSVVGTYGKFMIVEMVDDVPWIEDPTPHERKSLASTIREIDIKEALDDGSFILVATIIFKSALFKAEVKVDKEGFVDITGQDLIQEDMPIHSKA
ncbi:MAG TPA: hypothetical protein DHW10_00285 [Rhodospirillaceae bacterium]|nr:hypothetical protein [Rhodospirillaceae bacterium]|tara:strand:+ start:1149 stop:1805 length:657 start_codon:yes stop_codon:yes gene_type:complete